MNMMPMMKSFFTLIGFGVIVRHGARKEDREVTADWLKVQVERFF